MSSDQFEVDVLSLSYGDNEDEEILIIPFDGNPKTLGFDAPPGSIILTPTGVIHQKIGVQTTDWTDGQSAGEVPSLILSTYLDRHVLSKEDEYEIDTVNWLDYLDEQITIAHNAKYLICTSWRWSLDSTSDDFEIELLVDNIVVWDAAIEPKDKKNQIIPGTYAIPLDLTQGDHTIVLRFRPSKRRKDAVMYSASITVERFI